MFRLSDGPTSSETVDEAADAVHVIGDIIRLITDGFYKSMQHNTRLTTKTIEYFPFCPSKLTSIQRSTRRRTQFLPTTHTFL